MSLQSETANNMDLNNTTKAKIVNELHRPARRNFTRRKTVLKGIRDLYQIDLADYQNIAKFNKGYKYILVVINCFSKFLMTKPLKSKSTREVSDAMRSILDEYGPVKNVQSDQGLEFFGSHFQKLMKEFNINHYHTYSVIKCSMVERVIRTLKSKLQKLFHMTGTYNWVDKLKEVTNEYNTTKHSTTKLKPIEVKMKHEKQLLSTVYKRVPTVDAESLQRLRYKPRYQVGDTVRISKQKNVFEKGYTANWTTELFKISDVNSTYPPTYNLSDLNERPILGCFYQEELQKTEHPDVYLVEKILSKKKNKVYVKWLGFDDTHNSWINANNFRD